VIVPEQATSATVIVDSYTAYRCTAAWLSHGMVHGLGQRLVHYGAPIKPRPVGEPELRSWPTRRVEIQWGPR